MIQTEKRVNLFRLKIWLSLFRQYTVGLIVRNFRLCSSLMKQMSS